MNLRFMDDSRTQERLDRLHFNFAGRIVDVEKAPLLPAFDQRLEPIPSRAELEHRLIFTLAWRHGAINFATGGHARFIRIF
jgi:hypothetical protein